MYYLLYIVYTYVQAGRLAASGVLVRYTVYCHLLYCTCVRSVL